MPGIPLVSREAKYTRDYEIRGPLSEEEQAEAEESFSVYVRPIELYEILIHRARQNASFLQRCLHYKLQEKHTKKVELSISVSRHDGDGLQTESLFPFYILLARPVPDSNGETSRSSCYRFKRSSKLKVINGVQPASSTQAKFILPEINTLSTELKSGSITMLLVSYADITNQKEINRTKYHKLSSTHDGYCLSGKIPLDFLHSENECRTISLGERVQKSSLVTMRSCSMKSSYCKEDKEKDISFHFPHNSEAVSILQQVSVVIQAEELGKKDKSLYDLNSCYGIPSRLPDDVPRIRSGNVIFNYKYYKNSMQRSEVTEDYSCPFCLIKGGSYKGLRCHLKTSHDLFSYEFWVNKNYQVVVVTVKSDTWTSEMIGSTNPRKDTFFICLNKPMRPPRKNLNTNHGRPRNLETILSDLRGVSEHVECDAHSPNAPCVSNDVVTPLCGQEPGTQLVPVSNLSPPTHLEFGKTRKLSTERSHPRNQVLLRKHHFFHSHRAQPMALEQVLADEDSEDEVDDDVADLEDRRMLDDFVDVAQNEKQLMHLWNSFARKQRLLADVHVSWVCEAFSDFHGKYLVETPGLHWGWNLFLIKLHNHGLLDSKTMNKCHLILKKYQV